MSSCENLIDAESDNDRNDGDCPDSSSDDDGFSLGCIDMRDEDGALSALLDEFRDNAHVSRGGSRQYPPIILLLQHFEVYLPKASIKRIAVIMSSFFLKYKDNVKTDIYISSTRSLFSELRAIIGKNDFDRVSRELRKGTMTMALGLAPSLKLRSKNCIKCSGRRILHLFCPECGMLFDIKNELCKEMNLSKPHAKSPVKKRRRDSNTHLSAEEIRVRNASNFRRRRNRAGMAGISSLFNAAKKDREFRAIGGDVLFLMSRMAVTTTGEHRNSATSYFQELCIRWMRDKKERMEVTYATDYEDERSEEIRKDHFLKEVAEGLYPIKKMLRSGSEESKLFFGDGTFASKIEAEGYEFEFAKQAEAFKKSLFTDDKHKDRVRRQFKQRGAKKTSDLNQNLGYCSNISSPIKSFESNIKESDLKKESISNLNQDPSNPYERNFIENIIRHDDIYTSKMEVSPVVIKFSSYNASVAVASDENRFITADAVNCVGIGALHSDVDYNAVATATIETASTHINYSCNEKFQNIAECKDDDDITTCYPPYCDSMYRPDVSTKFRPEDGAELSIITGRSSTDICSPGRSYQGIPVIDRIHEEDHRQFRDARDVEESSGDHGNKNLVRYRGRDFLRGRDTNNSDNGNDNNDENKNENEKGDQVDNFSENDRVMRDGKESNNQGVMNGHMMHAAKGSHEDGNYNDNSDSNNNDRDDMTDSHIKSGPYKNDCVSTAKSGCSSTSNNRCQHKLKSSHGSLRLSSSINTPFLTHSLTQSPIQNPTQSPIRSLTKSHTSTPSQAVSHALSHALVPLCFTEMALAVETNLSQYLHTYQEFMVDFKPLCRDSDRKGKKKGRGTPLLPLNQLSLCGNCHRIDNNNRRQTCSLCDHKLEVNLNYSSITDTLLWSFIFASLEIEGSDRYERCCRNIIQLLPIVRCYRSNHELGSELFKAQCYCVTHIVFFFSDYGKHALNRQLFAEEFRFFIENIEYAHSVLKDVEIVGEFLQCLKVLQYTEAADPELEPIVSDAMTFLVKGERDGKWPSREKRPKIGDIDEYDHKYREYHTSYCAAMALLEYGFSQNDADRLCPPLPAVLSFCKSNQAEDTSR